MPIGSAAVRLAERHLTPPAGLLLFGEQVLQIGKGLRGGAIGACLAIAPGLNGRVVFEFTRVLIVVAVQTEQFPVAAVGWVVVVIVVAVMDGQLPQVRVGEFAAAAATDPGIDLEGLLPVALLALFRIASGLGNYPIQLARVAHCHPVLRISLGRGHGHCPRTRATASPQPRARAAIAER